MFKLFAVVLQALWPFIKESMLEGGTIKDWVMRNKIACAWIVMLLTMFCIVLYLADMLTISRQTEYAATRRADIAEIQLVSLKEQQVSNVRLLQETQNANVLLAQKLSEAATLNAKYEEWLGNCNIDINYSGTGYPSCPVKTVVKNVGSTTPTRKPPKKPVVKQPVVPVPDTEKTAKRRGFIKTLKSIFGNDDQK